MSGISILCNGNFIGKLRNVGDLHPLQWKFNWKTSKHRGFPSFEKGIESENFEKVENFHLWNVGKTQICPSQMSNLFPITLIVWSGVTLCGWCNFPSILVTVYQLSHSSHCNWAKGQPSTIPLNWATHPSKTEPLVPLQYNLATHPSQNISIYPPKPILPQVSNFSSADDTHREQMTICESLHRFIRLLVSSMFQFKNTLNLLNFTFIEIR